MYDYYNEDAIILLIFLFPSLSNPSLIVDNASQSPTPSPDELEAFSKTATFGVFSSSALVKRIGFYL